MGQNSDNFSGSQLTTEPMDRPGRYKVKIDDRVRAYHDDVNSILSLYRRPHELFENGELLVFNENLMSLEFEVLQVKLHGDRNKRRIVSISKNDISLFGFSFVLNTKNGVEQCIAIRLNHFNGINTARK